MSFQQFKLYFANNDDVWLELADAATTHAERQYCVKRYLDLRKNRLLPWWKRIMNFVLDIWNTL